MTATISIESNLQWMATRTRAGKWVGACDPLNIAMEADSLDDLYSLIPESIHLLFLDLLLDKELDDFLRARGWTAHYPANRNIKGDDVKFNVPWQLIAENVRANSTRVSH